jgi:hypothetical protein
MDTHRPQNGVDEPNETGLIGGPVQLPPLAVRGIIAVEPGGSRHPLSGDGYREEPLASEDL